MASIPSADEQQLLGEGFGFCTSINLFSLVVVMISKVQEWTPQGLFCVHNPALPYFKRHSRPTLTHTGRYTGWELGQTAQPLRDRGLQILSEQRIKYLYNYIQA
jgi:hypothetical protein